MRKGEIRSADEIQLFDLDEIKSVLLPHSGFHRVSDFIHGSGFLPFVRTDFIEKATCFRKSLFHGAGDEARTRYLHLGKVALYRMSYTRIVGDSGRN